MEVLATTSVTLDEPSRGSSFLAQGALYSLPITVALDGESYPLAVVTALAAEAGSLLESATFAGQFGLSAHVAEKSLSFVAEQIDTAANADAYRTLLETTVRVHVERLKDAAEHRQELALEQSRGRHLLLRAESLERQLLRGNIEVERASAAGQIPTRELAAILDNPQIGVTIEDTDHLVRYQNPMLRRAFGNNLGRKCYEAFKGRSEPCRPCPIQQIWEEGMESVRYTTKDERSQRSFEIIAFPMVGGRGEKLVVEVGVEVTALVQQRAVLEERLERSSERVGQLHALLTELSAVLQGTCSGVKELMDSDDAGGLAALRQRVGATGRLAESLSLPLGSGPTDAPLLLQSALDEAQEEGFSVPSVRLPVMPDIPASEPLMRALFNGLVRHLLASRAEPYPDLDFSHTMSGSPGAIAPGDAYHLLFLGPRRPSAEFAEDEVSTLPALGGEAEIIAGAPDVHLAQASLVARKLGGVLWRQLHAGGTITYFLSLPVELVE